MKRAPPRATGVVPALTHNSTSFRSTSAELEYLRSQSSLSSRQCFRFDINSAPSFHL